MSVASLRQAISDRARDLLVPALLEAGVVAHKKNWRTCPCSWCAKKREATVVIGTHVPRMWGEQDAREMRNVWREERRQSYRKQLSALEKCD